MANSKGTLQITGPDRIADLRVLDASRREVAAGIHRLEVELDPGIYVVQAMIPGDRLERLVAVESDSTSLVHNFKLQFDSSIPLISVRSTHEYHENAARDHSRNVHAILGSKPTARLFLFARTKGEARSEHPTFVLRGQDSSVSFPEAGAFDLAEGWIALTIDLPPGTYTLEQEVPGLERVRDLSCNGSTDEASNRQKPRDEGQRR